MVDELSHVVSNAQHYHQGGVDPERTVQVWFIANLLSEDRFVNDERPE